MSAQSLRLLLIEDDEDDATLVLRELRRSGYDIVHTRVETRQALERELDAGSWNVIVSDYALPHFDGLSAYSLVRERGLDVPFLIVSGKIGEDVAVAAMKAGVHDFVLKDRLGRLGPAVARELREAELRAERRKLQEHLMLSDRLASLGMLAASVAHEINNPLASVLMNLEFSLANAQEQGSFQESLQAMREAFSGAGLIRDIIRDIKIFSRPDGHHFGPTDVHRVLDSALRMAHNQLFHRARLVKDYGELPPVHGSEARLGQVFLNLIINAAQAVPDGHRDANEVRVVTRQDGERVRVEIRDTGPGIPPELRERIFEPFFTTKDASKGTGLGLSTVYGIVQQSGGSITVASELGKGTTFSILMPAGTGDLQAQVPRPLGDRPGHGVETILVVEDEEALRAVTERILTRNGYRVLGADSGVAALVIAGDPELHLDLLLTDVVMPRMNGRQLAERVRDIRPGVPVVYMSGYAQPFINGEGTLEPNTILITKPFTQAELLERLREALDRA
jgi:signal transduction histidine kinase